MELWLIEHTLLSLGSTDYPQASESNLLVRFAFGINTTSSSSNLYNHAPLDTNIHFALK